MKKLNLLLFFSILLTPVFAQIKVYPGGTLSLGTLTQPTGYYRSLFGGPVQINQSASDQTLLYLNGVNQLSYSNVMVSKNNLP